MSEPAGRKGGDYRARDEGWGQGLGLALAAAAVLELLPRPIVLALPKNRRSRNNLKHGASVVRAA